MENPSIEIEQLEQKITDRYQITRQLGVGGMGSVWLAEDLTLDRLPVAVKTLPPALTSDRRAVRQLKDEALIARKLSHPNIATLRDFNLNDGNPFLVMDYIAGQTLADLLAARGTLSEQETLALLTPIAAAIDYAHDEGVVHRDIKPANVMVRTDGHPFILDFGISQEIRETLTHITNTPSTNGTLVYMSPEQLDGAAPQASQDVYSFAALAYECLTGHPPFFRGAIEDQIRNRLPDPLPRFVSFGDAVMAGLAKTAECRPASCQAVLRCAPAGAGRAKGPKEDPSSTSHRALAFATQEDAARARGLADAASNGSRSEAYLQALVNWNAGLDSLTKQMFVQAKNQFAEAQHLFEISTAETASAHSAKPKTKTLRLPGNVQLKLVWCPPGTFTMGSPLDEAGRYEDETPHKVSLTKGFWIGRYPVTQAQWKAVMEDSLWSELTGRNPSMFKSDDRPVENVSWNDCQKFLQKTELGLRLPTEAEWEYACRAGDSTATYGGLGLIDELGWHIGNSSNETHTVGRKRPNAWGLYDMLGNVWEWCEDWYGEYPESAVDPTGPSEGRGRIYRGGCWRSLNRFCRATFRFWSDPRYRSRSIGFRVVLPDAH